MMGGSRVSVKTTKERVRNQLETVPSPYGNYTELHVCAALCTVAYAIWTVAPASLNCFCYWHILLLL